jgi:hypothetical protein
MAGKPNKDFLAKPKRTHKRISNMTIDNIKDKPDLPRTDDVILQNFVECYAKLYEHKGVCPIALNILITNLTLNLDDKEVERLEAPIKESKMLRTNTCQQNRPPPKGIQNGQRWLGDHQRTNNHRPPQC